MAILVGSYVLAVAQPRVYTHRQVPLSGSRSSRRGVLIHCAENPGPLRELVVMAQVVRATGCSCERLYRARKSTAASHPPIPCPRLVTCTL
ncbi:hypothetical protein EXIGLDRAFT_226018 [Exidia glandulosa HHB12029]|uniref:Uncharacterized protein n=1 Tax=Exidia glandulosa HHB12029 TaxID=1314781 RepID=A0A165E9P9_EXIGL|nr:hypothetical protein EXIGLDRAFT_226018 [Exidia glandulosa HHB12029]